MTREMQTMKKMMVEAGFNPDRVAVDSSSGPSIEAEPSKQNKKRRPSGSPEGKVWQSSSSASGSDSGDEAMEKNDCPKKDDLRKEQYNTKLV